MSNTPTQKPNGSIHLTIGPMFSGKTSDLIRRVGRHNIAKQPSIVVKFDGDDRYSSGDEVVTHDGTSHVAIRATMLSSIEHELEKYGVVGIDEVQFYDDAVEVCTRLVNRGIKIYACGLSGKSDASPWRIVSRMIPLADSLLLINAVCVNENCGMDATFTHRIKEVSPEQGDVVSDIKSSADLIAIGGTERYLACCRKCWIKLQTPPVVNAS